MKHYENRFHMTPEQSLFLAKKKWDENVYCGMRMENRNITFPQTKTILQGVNVPSVQLDDPYFLFVSDMALPWRAQYRSMIWLSSIRLPPLCVLKGLHLSTTGWNGMVTKNEKQV